MVSCCVTKTQKIYESTKIAASYSQSLSKCRSLQCEIKFHVDELFEFDSSVPMSAELHEPRPSKDSFKQDAASRPCYANTRDVSSISIALSLLICKTLMKFLLTVISLTYKCSPLLGCSALSSLAQGHQTQL